MLKELRWTVRKNYIFKSELAILDLLNQTKWTRPIYFEITTGSDAYFNLDDYFRLDGLAYRLTPIKSENTDGQTGWIDTDILYDKLMNKFVVGNINKEHVYLDEN